MWKRQVMRKIGGYKILNDLLLLLKYAMHFFITTVFALSYDSPHGIAGKDVVNDLNGVIPK